MHIAAPLVGRCTECQRAAEAETPKKTKYKRLKWPLGITDAYANPPPHQVGTWALSFGCVPYRECSSAHAAAAQLTHSGNGGLYCNIPHSVRSLHLCIDAVVLRQQGRFSTNYSLVYTVQYRRKYSVA